MSNRTRRRAGGGVRQVGTLGDGTRYVDLRIVQYNVVDDYGSVWLPGVFDASLGQRWPTLAWGHDWSEPIGRGFQRLAEDDGPVVRFRVDDPEAVPTARRALAQVESGTIDDCSVGFVYQDRRDPTDEEMRRWPGVRELVERADLDEVSLVLRGAVPGAGVLAGSLRAAAGQVTMDDVLELARRVDAGEITRAQADAALALLAGEKPPPPPGDPGAQGDPPTDGDAAGGLAAAEVDALLLDADAALDGAL